MPDRTDIVIAQLDRANAALDRGGERLDVIEREQVAITSEQATRKAASSDHEARLRVVERSLTRLLVLSGISGLVGAAALAAVVGLAVKALWGGG